MRGVVGFVVFVCLCVCVGVGFVSCQPIPLASDSVTFQLSQTQVAASLSARTVLIRWLYSINTQISATLIQYSNVSLPSGSTGPSDFHNSIVSGTSVNDDHEIGIPQIGFNPVTSYVIRNLKPSTTYFIRVVYNDTTSPPKVLASAATAISFTTPVLSGNTGLSWLNASGGCGQLTSSNQMYGLNFVTDGSGNRIYSCQVVAEMSNITIGIIPQYAYASIATNTIPALLATNSTVLSAQADPLPQYTTTLTLNPAGSVTNFTWVVTAENGANQTYILSVTRAIPATTATLNGPSNLITALLTTPSSSTPISYRALLWSGNTVTSWRAWSDDLKTFPYSSLVITPSSDRSSATLFVTPATSSVSANVCSPVSVAIFDSLGGSVTVSTCINSLEDICSSTPYGSALNWQTQFVNGVPQSSQLYFPAPPVPWFPAA